MRSGGPKNRGVFEASPPYEGPWWETRVQKSGGWPALRPAPRTRGAASREICLCGVVGAIHFGKRIPLPCRLTPKHLKADLPTQVLYLALNQPQTALGTPLYPGLSRLNCMIRRGAWCEGECAFDSVISDVCSQRKCEVACKCPDSRSQNIP